ncbi:MAG: hypothetical protein JRI68_33265 [Deltaproteobacteria bacterium]|nr:hypothetical protein [Deltaproteobacteria bacterium]
MKFEFLKLTSLIAATLLLTSCPQEDIELPDMGGGAAGTCGAWYPGDCSDAGTDDCYGLAEGSIFPCAVWESARLAGDDTFINLGDVHLEAKHGTAGPKAIVIVVSAENCPSCTSLINAMTTKVTEFADAGAMMIGMARRDLLADPTNEDFDLDKAESTLRAEKWPTNDWHVINDEEDYLDTSFDVNTPWVILIGTKDMVVESAANDDFSPDPAGVTKLLNEIGKL